MHSMKGLVPRLFLTQIGVDARHPAWFVMLLAAMVSGAVYSAAWLVAMLFLPTVSLSAGEPVPVGVVALLTLTMWGTSTLWYHVLYLVWYRRSRTAGTGMGVESHYSVWGGPLSMILVLLAKMVWMLLKYVVAPLIPFMLVVELRSIPGIGAAICNVACVALTLYPVIALACYAVGRTRQRPRSDTQ